MNAFLNKLLLPGGDGERLCRSVKVIGNAGIVCKHVYSVFVIIILEGEYDQWKGEKTANPGLNAGVVTNHVEIRSGSD